MMKRIPLIYPAGIVVFLLCIVTTGFSQVSQLDRFLLSPSLYNQFSAGRDLLSDQKSVAIGFPSMNAQWQSSFLSWDLLQRDFSKDQYGNSPSLTTAEKQSILDMVRNGTLSFTAAAELQELSLSIKLQSSLIATFSVFDRFDAGVVTPKDFLELAFLGNTPGKTFTFDGTREYSSWLRGYGVGISTTLLSDDRMRLDFHTRVAYYTGYGISMTSAESASLFTADSDYSIKTKGNFLTYHSITTNNSNQIATPHGKGYGLDFMVNLSTQYGLNVLVGMLDVGSVNWDGIEMQQGGGSYLIHEITTTSLGDSIDNAYSSGTPQIVSVRTSLPKRFIGRATYVYQNFSGVAGASLLSESDLSASVNEWYLMGEWKPWPWLQIGLGNSISNLSGYAVLSSLEVTTRVVRIGISNKNFLGVSPFSTSKSGSASISFLLKL